MPKQTPDCRNCITHIFNGLRQEMLDESITITTQDEGRLLLIFGDEIGVTLANTLARDNGISEEEIFPGNKFPLEIRLSKDDVDIALEKAYKKTRLTTRY